MEIAVNELGPCQKSVKVTISAEEIGKKYEEYMQDLNQNASIPGFRPGRIPRSVLEKKFGKAITSDLRNFYLASAYQEAIKTHNIVPVAEPVFKEEDIQIENNKPCSFEIVFETQPVFTLPEYKGIEVKKKAATVNNEEVENALKELQRLKGERVPLESGKTQEHDIIVGNIKITSGDAVVWEKENVTVPVTDSRLLGLPLEKTFLENRGKDEVCEKTFTFPKDFKETQYVEKEGKLTLTILDIKRLSLPELNDAFAKEMGAENLEDLKTKVLEEIKGHKSMQADASVATDITTFLVSKTDMAIPPRLLAERMAKGRREYARELAYRRHSREEIEELLKKDEKEIQDAVTRDIKEYFILEEIAKKENVTVNSEEMEEEIKHIASHQRKWPNEVRAYLEKEGLMPEIEAQVRQRKVMEFLRKEAKVSEEN